MVASSPYVLVLGSSRDTQLADTIERLRALGVDCLFLDHDAPEDFVAEMDAEGKLTLYSNGTPIPAPSLVWKRLKQNSVPSVWNEETLVDYVRAVEWSGFLNGLATLFADKMAYAHHNAWAIESRLYQLGVAAQSGFVVPPSALSVSAPAAIRFVDRHPDAVVKPLLMRNVPRLSGNPQHYRVMMTTAVSRSDVSGAPAGEFDTPVFLQSRLRRGVEYRVLAFREAIFAYEIRQKLESRVRVDERVLLYGEDGGVPLYLKQYRACSPPTAIVEPAKRFLELAGLEYAALDVVVDEEDAIFIEANAEGQWTASVGRNYDSVVDHWASVIQRRIGELR